MSDIERGRRRRKRGGGRGWWGGIRGDEERRDNDRKRGGSENIKERLQVGMEREMETERMFLFYRAELRKHGP